MSLITLGSSRFTLTDISGKFKVERTLKANKEKNVVLLMKDVKSVIDSGKSLEALFLKMERFPYSKGSFYLGPVKTKYEVSIEGKPYRNQIIVNYAKRKAIVHMSSPELMESRREEFDFPSNLKILCSFESIIECAKQTGFIAKAVKKNAGVMNVYLLLESFPYFQLLYKNISYELFHKATLRYDKFIKKTGHRFALEFSGQLMYYILDEKGVFIKMVWIAEGVNLIHE